MSGEDRSLSLSVRRVVENLERTRRRQAMSAPNEVEWCHCNKCMQRTRHRTLFSESRGEEVGDSISGNDYQVLECQGCGSIAFRQREWCSEWVDEDGPCYQSTYYPPPISRKIPGWVDELPFEIRAVLNEVYTALHSGNPILATFGARTVLDLVMVDKLGEDVGSFDRKVKTLEANGHLTRSEAELIEAALEAGHASAHRGYAPDTNGLNSVMDILESVLDKFYAAAGRQRKLAAQAAALRRRVPPRTI